MKDRDVCINKKGGAERPRTAIIDKSYKKFKHFPELFCQNTTTNSL